MTFISGIILFLVGFAAGAGIVWFLRQKEIDAAQSNRDQLKAEFGDLSKQALDKNLDTFFILSEFAKIFNHFYLILRQIIFIIPIFF